MVRWVEWARLFRQLDSAAICRVRDDCAHPARVVSLDGLLVGSYSVYQYGTVHGRILLIEEYGSHSGR
jgi:hypothetical protein